MEIFLDTINDGLRLLIPLEQDASPAGTYVYPNQGRINQIDNFLLKGETNSDSDVSMHMVTGRTDSKLYAIENSIKTLTIPETVVYKKIGNKFGQATSVVDFDIKKFLNQPIRISGTDITAVITEYSSDKKSYTLYSDTEFPIKYVDFPDGTTTFIFNKIAEEITDAPPLLNKYSGLVEEPKIESSVFIERGIVNVFEPFTKLKKVKSLNEMTKFGFGYFKINKEGFNF